MNIGGLNDRNLFHLLAPSAKTLPESTAMYDIMMFYYTKPTQRFQEKTRKMARCKTQRALCKFFDLLPPRAP